MKQEALKALIMMAHKRMAQADPSEASPESKMSDLLDKSPAQPSEESPEAESEGESPKMEDVLSFMKSRSVPEPTSRMAAVAVQAKPMKAKGSNLFKKRS